MFEQLEWENIYKIWTRESYNYKTLDCPMFAETVFVDYNRQGYIYGYDWLENSQAQKRKLLIEQDPISFLYFTQPTNKGTIRTAEMLIEAQNEEELAAIWIAATAKELCEHDIRKDVRRYANMLYVASCNFLRSRYYLWHHAMRGLVPKIMIPESVLRSIVCEDFVPVIGIVQMNTIMLKNEWKILRYSSLLNGKVPESSCRITDNNL